jgi:hypothetical protein
MAEALNDLFTKYDVPRSTAASDDRQHCQGNLGQWKTELTAIPASPATYSL